jgi:hypothetical protein
LWRKRRVHEENDARREGCMKRRTQEEKGGGRKGRKK